MSLVRILKLLVLVFINASHSHCCRKLKKFFVFVGILEKGIAMGYDDCKETITILQFFQLTFRVSNT